MSFHFTSFPEFIQQGWSNILTFFHGPELAETLRLLTQALRAVPAANELIAEWRRRRCATVSETAISSGAPRCAPIQMVIHFVNRRPHLAGNVSIRPYGRALGMEINLHRPTLCCREIMAAGYVYVLANGSMPGLVKVGKTTRSPAERAEELSGATGIATPFMVVYEDYFEDCDVAEAFVHTKLSSKGLRMSDNREFFRAAVSDVVKVIASIRDSANCGAGEPDEAKELFTPDGPEFADLELQGCETNPWDELMEEGERHYYGFNGYLQDYGEAIKCFRAAARLGSPRAFRKLGDIYRYGSGVREDDAAAFNFYKEGAKKGNCLCYPQMAESFIETGQMENAKKCLQRLVAAVRTEGWRRHAEYPDDYLDGLKAILRSLTRTAEGVDHDLSRVIEDYIPDVIDRLQKWLNDPNSKLDTDRKALERKFLEILQRRVAKARGKSA